MFNIEKYLEKFSKNLNSAESNKKRIIEIIKKQTNLDFSAEQIEIKDYIVHIKASPALKNKIFIYKKAILDNIAFEKIYIMDIR